MARLSTGLWSGSVPHTADVGNRTNVADPAHHPGQVPATIVSALLFTIHHVIALMAFFDWRVTILASLGVFIGSAMWSWLYLRYRNLWTAYVCHVFADVGIFVIGWMLIFSKKCEKVEKVQKVDKS